MPMSPIINNTLYQFFSVLFVFLILLSDKNLVHSEQNSSDLKKTTESLSVYAYPDKFPDIVFDSSRDNTFGIYGMYLESGQVVEIVSTKEHEMFPEINSDQSYLVFSRHKGLERDGPSRVVLRSMVDGSEFEIDSGAFPSFSYDGKKVYYEKDRSQVHIYNIAEKSKSLLFPKKEHEFGSYEVVKPKLTNDETILVFTSDKGGKWHAWKVNLITGEQTNMGKGCEPIPHPQKDKILIVTRDDLKEHTKLTYYDRKTKTVTDYHDPGGTLDFKYFPSYSKDGKYLIYSSAPPGNPSHEFSNYQIFIKELATGKIERITNDSFNNRWAKFVYNGRD
jgi:Tol biopolymer transport system component